MYDFHMKSKGKQPAHRRATARAYYSSYYCYYLLPATTCYSGGGRPQLHQARPGPPAQNPTAGSPAVPGPVGPGRARNP